MNNGPTYFLSKIFTPPVLEKLVERFDLEKLSFYLRNALTPHVGKIPLGDAFNEAFQKLVKSYRCEYVYKNAIAEKLLLGRHSLKTANLLMEFRVSNCIADVVVLNGTSTVYEIKSEYDSLDRLGNQISAYSECFDNIYVVTHPSQLKELNNILPSHVGIIELTQSYTLRTIKQTQPNREKVNPRSIFSSLRRDEYLKIIGDHFGYLPSFDPVTRYKICKDRFSEIPPHLAHDYMVSVLNQRDKTAAKQTFVRGLPSSLKAIGLKLRLSNKNQLRLTEILAMKCSQILP